jgi:hypothetical protein
MHLTSVAPTRDIHRIGHVPLAQVSKFNSIRQCELDMVIKAVKDPTAKWKSVALITVAPSSVYEGLGPATTVAI